MGVIDYRESDLEKWLRKRNMTTNEFLELVGCSRPILWKVKTNQAIVSKYAKKIIEITEGEIKPLISEKGKK